MSHSDEREREDTGSGTPTPLVLGARGGYPYQCPLEVALYYEIYADVRTFR